MTTENFHAPDLQDDAEFAFGEASLAQGGALEVRLAENQNHITLCQKLRFDVFFKEMSAKPSPDILSERRDFDRFDGFCDHLMVIDRSGPPKLVGTYRLLRKAVADANGGYYSASEYDLSPFASPDHARLNILELGRSCVQAEYRTKPVIDLLWRSIGAYLQTHKIDLMFGCASFEGRDPDAHALALTYLARNHLAPAAWRAQALPHRYERLDRCDELDPRRAWRALPPIIRGYIRAGAFIGDGAVIDDEFGTVDVLIIFPVSEVSERYSARFMAKPGDPA